MKGYSDIMSGGSFEYVCFKLQDGEAIEIPDALPQLKKMELFLRQHNKHEAANELLRGILRMETAIHRLSVVGEHLFELAHTTEWWASGDLDEKTFDEEFEENYINKK